MDRLHYRQWLHVRRPDLPFFWNGAEVPPDQTCARVRRKGASHSGIGGKKALRELVAGAADQAFLDEIAELTDLEYLELEWPLTAMDLAPLRSLAKLRTLRIDSPRGIADFSPLLDLPLLDRLFIENAKHLHALDWLRPLKDRLVALGIEGSIRTPQRIASLAPLSGFALEALFLTSTRLDDQDLSPLATMPNLQILETGLNAPRRQFLALRESKPGLECRWFDETAWDGFRDPHPPRTGKSRS